jgi:hypothetical protein
MKKVLLVTTCLVVVSTASPAVAECPYLSHLNSLNQQLSSAKSAMGSTETCSAASFAAGERLIAIAYQIEGVMSKIRADRRCVVIKDKGSPAEIAKALSGVREACNEMARLKSEMAKLKAENDRRPTTPPATQQPPTQSPAKSPATPSTRQKGSCSDITGTGHTSGDVNVINCKSGNALLEKARQFRKDYPALKDSDRQVKGWRELYREAAAQYRVAGDPERADRLDKEANAPDPEPFVKFDRNETANFKRQYHVREAEDEYRRGNAIMNPENKPSCYDANIAADLFESAAKDFAAAGNISKSEESNVKSVAIRKQVNDGIKTGRCNLDIGPKPNASSLRKAERKAEEDFERGSALAATCGDSAKGADLIDSAAEGFAEAGDFARSKASREKAAAIRKKIKEQCPQQGDERTETEALRRKLADRLNAVQNRKYKHDSCEYMMDNPKAFKELIETQCKEETQ